MTVLMLLTSGTEVGTVVSIESARTSFGSPRKEVDIRLTPDVGDVLMRSAEIAVSAVYEILWRESHVRRATTCRLVLDDVPVNTYGRSAELAFAIACALACTGRDDCSIAATGVIGAAGSIDSVDKIATKARAAIAALPDGGLFLFPKANDGDIPPPLIGEAEAKGIRLVPVDRLDQALESVGVPIRKIYLDTPYRGLEPFLVEHESIFFGRDAETSRALDVLQLRASRGEPSLLVIGPSGSGKSSFVHAGLVAQLGRTDSTCRWRTYRPSDALKYDGSIEVSLARIWTTSEGTACNSYREVESQLVKNENGTTVLVVDQLEELFTLAFSDSSIASFGAFLTSLQSRGVCVLATLRSDFYGQYQDSPELVSLFEADGHFDLLPVSEAGVQAIIEKPAEAADVVFDVDENGVSLATRLRIEAQATGESLPLLEHVLTLLFRRRKGNVLCSQEFDRLGGLRGAVGAYAEEVYSALPAQYQSELSGAIRQLAFFREGHPVSRPARLADIVRNENAQSLISRLIEARLVVADGGNVVLVHDALLRGWPRVARQLERERTLIEQRDYIERRWADWRVGPTEHMRHRLLSRADLKIVRRLESQSQSIISGFLRDYIVRSRLYQRRKLHLFSLLVASVVVAVSLGQVAYIRDRNHTNSVALATVAENELEAGRHDRALRIAVVAASQSMLSPGSPEARNVLARTAQETPWVSRILLPDATSGGVLSPDLTRALTWGIRGSPIRLWDVSAGEAIVSLGFSNGWEGDELFAGEAGFSPDGTRLLTVSQAEKMVTIYDARRGTLVAAIEVRREFGHDSPHLTATFLSNERILTKVPGPGGYHHYDLWDAQTGGLVTDFDDVGGNATVSPDGSRLSLFWSAGPHRIWSVRSGLSVAAVAPSDSQTDWMQFSPDGTSLVSGHGRHVTVWDADTGLVRWSVEHPIPENPLPEPWTDREWANLVSRRARFSGDGKVVARMVTNPVLITDPGTNVDTTIYVWDASTGTELATLVHDESLTGYLLSRDGKRLVGWGGSDLLVWDVDTETLTQTRQTDADSILDARLFQEDRRILWWDQDIAGVDDIYSLHGPTVSESGVRHLQPSDDGSKIWMLSRRSIMAWSADNAQLARRVDSGDNGRILMNASGRVFNWGGLAASIWKLDTGEEAVRITHEQRIAGGVLSGDQRIALTWSQGRGQGLVWNTTTGERFPELDAGTDGIGLAALAEDGSVAITWATNRQTTLPTLRLWDAQTGKQIAAWEGVFRLEEDDSAFVAGVPRIVFGDAATGEIVVVDGRDGTELTRLPYGSRPAVRGARLAKWHVRLVTWGMHSSGDRLVVKVWNLDTNEEIATLEYEGWTDRDTPWFELSRDQTQLLAWRSAGATAIDIISGSEVAEYPHNWPRGARYSYDEQHLITWDDRTITIWDAASGKDLSTLRIGSDDFTRLHGVGWSHDGGTVVVWTDLSVWTWDWRSNVSRRLEFHESHVGSARGAAFSSDDSMLLTWSDTAARVWDAATGQLLADIRYATSLRRSVNQPVVQFAPDEARVISWFDGAHIWDIEYAKAAQHDDNSLVDAVCGELLSSESVREIRNADADIAPLLRDHVGEDVCELGLRFWP